MVAGYRPSHAWAMRTCRPLSLSNVRTPFLPVLGTLSVLLESLLLLGEILVAVKDNHGVAEVVSDLADCGDAQESRDCDAR